MAANAYAKLRDDVDEHDVKDADEASAPPRFEQLQLYGPACDDNCECFDDTTTTTTTTTTAPAAAGLSWLDRFLTVWILAAIGLGLLLGYFVPGISDAFAGAAVANVSVPVAVGLFVMMYPVLCKVQYERIHYVLRERALWRQLCFSVVVNWVVGPLLMTGLAWLTLFDVPGYRTGVILVGLARCIAMVLLWNSLAGGSPDYCAILVAVNSILQLLLYGPLAFVYLTLLPAAFGADVSNVDIDVRQVALSVGVFLGVPLLCGVFTRLALRRAFGEQWFERVFVRYVSPLALVGLLYTVVILFTTQGHAILSDFVPVARVSVPLLLYFAVMFSLTLGAARLMRFSYEHAVTQALTASSNNFELAIAVAIAAFEVSSPEALAAVVGPLIEVPVLIGLVRIALALKPRW